MQRQKTIPQEHPMGCAVACVASNCQISYTQALELFQFPQNAWTRGFYCDEVAQALIKAGLNYTYEKFDFSQHIKIILKPGTIVFIDPNSQYTSGHFLLRLESGWMNPWSNFPQMIPVKSEIEENLPGEVSYVIFEKF